MVTVRDESPVGHGQAQDDGQLGIGNAASTTFTTDQSKVIFIATLTAEKPANKKEIVDGLKKLPGLTSIEEFLIPNEPLSDDDHATGGNVNTSTETSTGEVDELDQGTSTLSELTSGGFGMGLFDRRNDKNFAKYYQTVRPTAEEIAQVKAKETASLSQRVDSAMEWLRDRSETIINAEGKVIEDSADMINYLSRRHTGIKPTWSDVPFVISHSRIDFSCTDCKPATVHGSAKNLADHKEAAHPREKCSACRQTFVDKWALKDHLGQFQSELAQDGHVIWRSLGCPAWVRRV
jgi:hypothetical protein